MAADTHPDYTSGAFVICFISPSITISYWKAVLSFESTKELQTSIDVWNEARVVEKTPFYHIVYKQMTLILSQISIQINHMDCHSISNLIFFLPRRLQGRETLSLNKKGRDWGYMGKDGYKGNI